MDRIGHICTGTGSSVFGSINIHISIIIAAGNTLKDDGCIIVVIRIVRHHGRVILGVKGTKVIKVFIIGGLIHINLRCTDIVH